MEGTAYARPNVVRKVATVRAAQQKRSWVKRVFVDPFTREVSPMKQIMAEFRSNGTSNRVMNMEKALTAVLSKEGYPPKLHEEVRARKPADETDDMFAAALNLFAKDNGEVGSAAGKIAQELLNVGAVSGYLMENTLMYGIRSDGDGTIRRALSDEGKTTRIGKVIGQICWRLRLDSAEFVSDITESMQGIRDSGNDIQRRGAEAFFQRIKQMEEGVLDMPAVA